MASGQRRNVPVVPQSRPGLERLKQEVAQELGVQNYTGYLGDVPSRVNGAVGGNMVRRMIAAAEQALIEQASGHVQQGFRQALQGGSPQTSSFPQPQQGFSSGQRPLQ